MATWTREVDVSMKYISVSLANNTLSILESGCLTLKVIFHSQNLRSTAFPESHEANVSANEKWQ